MTSPLTDNEINNLYSKRKQQITVPEISFDNAIAEQPVKAQPVTKFSVKRSSAVLFSSLFASFAIFALITHLLPEKTADKISQNKSIKAIPVDLKALLTKNDEAVNLPNPPTLKIKTPKEKAIPPQIKKLPSEKAIVPQVTTPKSYPLNLAVTLSMPTLSLAQSTPSLAFKSLPKYPHTAAKKNIEGKVKLAFTITAQGNVEDITVVTATPAKTFDRAAKIALGKWKYQIPENAANDWVKKGNIVEFNFKLEK